MRRSVQWLRTAPRRILPRREMVMLNATDCGRKQPWVLRSSGNRHMRSRMAAAGVAADALAIAQHRAVVTDGEDFAQAVRDVDEADAFG